MSPVSRGIDRIAVTFDEDNLVANAGLLLVASVARRLRLESLINALVHIPSRDGGFKPGRKVLTLVHAIIAGASHIDHADMLRAGATEKVLPHKVMAPSTLGTFLRAFSFGHLRQLDAVVAEALRRAWSFTKLPERLVFDLDSTICEVTGKLKAGAAYGYTRVLGYHPILATRSDTGEVIHARLRKGSANTCRGAKRFVEELVARARRAGAEGKIVLRMDSGFWSKEILASLCRLGVSFTMAVKTANVAISRAIGQIDEDAWVQIEYPEDGEAQVAETSYKGLRLVVRRTRLVGPQASLWPNWRHFAFLTDLDDTATELDAFPPQPRRCRARHKGPKGGLWAVPPTLWELLGERGVACLCGARPQPRALDPDARRAQARRSPPRRGTDDAHQDHRRARTPRELLGDADASCTFSLAMARQLPGGPRKDPRCSTCCHLSLLPRSGAAADALTNALTTRRYHEPLLYRAPVSARARSADTVGHISLSELAPRH